MNKDESKDILTPEQQKMVMDARKAGAGISELGDDELDNVAGGLNAIIEPFFINQNAYHYCTNREITEDMFRIFLPGSFNGNSLTGSNGCPVGGPICPNCKYYSNYIN